MLFQRNRLNSLLNEISIGDDKNIEALISDVCYLFQISNLSYVGLNLRGSIDEQPYVKHTYSKAWENRYWDAHHIDIDPVVKQGFSALLPLDWNHMRNSASSRNFFNEAIEYDVGTQGITIPIRGPHGDSGVFSVSLIEKEFLWKRHIEECLPEIYIVAYYFHELIQTKQGLFRGEINLSKREIEVLRWFACGKSQQDVADILGISVHTVKTYSESARFRLNAMNTTHAVAKAISNSVIPPPD